MVTHKNARAARLALVLVTTVAAVSVAELTVRVLGLGPARFAQTRSIESDDKRTALDLYPDDPRDYFPIDLHDADARAQQEARGLGAALAGWERAPHGVAFDYTTELCRGESLSPDPSRARVVAIGDSFTEGQGVREQDTFVARLARRMPDAQFSNCGRRGSDFPALHDAFERHLAAEPDVVVYAMVLNDPEQSEAFRARQQYLDDWILDRRRMLGEGDDRARSPWQPRLWALLADRVEGIRVGRETTRWYHEMVQAPNAGGWRATIEHIVAMHETMRSRGGALVVALWPLLVELDGQYPFASTHRTIVDALGARGVEVRDTLPAFVEQHPESLWVHPIDRHPNERAHAIFASEIEETLRAAIGARRR